MLAHQALKRSIEEFKGDTVIIGCGNAMICRCHLNPCQCCQRPHKSDERFYTIDAATYCGPDLIYNITHPLPAKLQKRFTLSILENLDASAYNPRFLLDLEYKVAESSISGFNNVKNMTTDDGFIFIIGCPRDLKFRASLKDLKYIEYDDQDSQLQHECVLIPNNQKLSIGEIQNAIRRNQILADTIYYFHRKDPTENIQFCSIPVVDLRAFTIEAGLKTNISNTLSYLKDTINLLKALGKKIKSEGAIIEGNQAIKLAHDLNTKLNTFLEVHVKHPSTLLKNYELFKTDFTKTLNDQIIDHRTLRGKICGFLFSEKPKRQQIRDKINKNAAAFFTKTERYFQQVELGSRALAP